MGKSKKKSGGSGSVSPTTATRAGDDLRSPEKKPRRDEPAGTDEDDSPVVTPRGQGITGVDLSCLQGMFEKFAVEVTTELNTQMKEEFEKHTDKINQVTTKTSEMDQKLIEINANVSASSTMAQQALQAVADLKKEVSMGSSKAPSEASTEVPLSSRFKSYIPSYQFNPQHPPVASPSDCERSPDNDGTTVLVGGFPRDTERQTMQDFLTEKLGSTIGIKDLEAKYRLGSTALMRFKTPTLMWTFMRSRPTIQFEDKKIFFTIPKSPAERSRDKKLVIMRNTIELNIPSDKKVTIQWNEKAIMIDNMTVARYCPEKKEMQLSASQLRASNITMTTKTIMGKFQASLETSAPSASNIKDWS